MVERRIAKLKFTHEEAIAYVPPLGIDVCWLDFFPQRQEAYAEFIVSDVQPDPLLRKTVKDIRHELGTTLRNRVLQDGLTDYPKRNRRALRIEALLSHPFLQLRNDAGKRDIQRAIDSATDLHEIELTPDQFMEATRPKDMSLEKHKARGPIEIQPKEVRQKTVYSNKIEETDEVDRYDQEVYVVDVGEIDSG